MQAGVVGVGELVVSWELLGLGAGCELELGSW